MGGRKTRARRQARPGGRTGGGRRGRSSGPGARLRPGETQSSASSRSTILAAGLARSLWRDGEEGVRAADKVGGEVERGGGGERGRGCGGFDQAGSPGLGRPPPSDLRPGSRIFLAISGRGRAQRSRRARTRSNAQRARISASAAGASGKAEKVKAAALAAAETGSPCPAQAFRLDREAVRVRDGQVERRRGVGEPARHRDWVGGRRGRATA